MRAAYGFDKPLPVQYALWFWQVLHGDLGTSIATGRPVASEVSRALGNTLILATRCHRDRLRLRHVVRLRRRLLPRIVARSARVAGIGARRERAALLARHGAGHHLLRRAQLAAADRRRSGRLGRLASRRRASALHHPAGHHHVGHPDGRDRAHGAGTGRATSSIRNSSRRCAPRACASSACSATS